MVLSRNNQTHILATSASNTGKKTVTKTHPLSWSKVVSGQVRTTHSFRPAILTPVPTATVEDTDEDPSLSTEPTVEFIKPYLKGIEKNSILIDITDIKDAHMLRKALQAFNKDADEETGCDDYCGRLPSTRRYLKRSFIETAWTKDSPGYQGSNHYSVCRDLLRISVFFL
ncbi:uncharacterized protein B0P05DRAFT_635220 [Gilbertella persicaria]|uniref:uncharacterized protein n=1 Tax=Gilbertella persicaria TaxID=101096 RepID=UPI002220AC97|nr:uncharacterized protein B0P05DRAFT_635220 [Gilbertella persicaria]KAI8088006.1 hypothetical protein B0P05DRAFT_635220 [Gilbertella persicaria]